MLTRFPGACVRAILVMWMIATPALLIPTGSDTAQITALVAVLVGVVVLLEYAAHYPSWVEFRHAPPYNRVRFISLFISLFLVTVMLRGQWVPAALSDFLWAIGGLVGLGLALPFAPGFWTQTLLPAGASAAQVDALYAAMGLAALCATLSVIGFVVALRIESWPGRSGAFNMWLNFPTFDPTAGGDVVGRLYRDARVNLLLAIVLPGLLPMLAAVALGPSGLLVLTSPQVLIWAVTLWAFLPAFLIMRSIALARIARLVEVTRRRRYAQMGEDAALA